jgi:hypothetical protein
MMGQYLRWTRECYQRFRVTTSTFNSEFHPVSMIKIRLYVLIFIVMMDSLDLYGQTERYTAYAKMQYNSKYHTIKSQEY